MFAFSATRPGKVGMPAGEFVLELRGAAKSNPLYGAYRLLSSIGVQVVQTRLRVEGDRSVQTLHLAELDDSDLAPRRISQVLDTLRVAWGLAPISAGNVVPPSVSPIMTGAAAFDAIPSLVEGGG